MLPMHDIHRLKKNLPRYYTLTWWRNRGRSLYLPPVTEKAGIIFNMSVCLSVCVCVNNQQEVKVI